VAHFCLKFNNNLSLGSKRTKFQIFNFQVVNKKQQQVRHISQSAFCFMLIHVQLQLPATRAQTKKTSYSLFNKLA